MTLAVTSFSPNQWLQATPGCAFLFSSAHWSGAPEPKRSAAGEHSRTACRQMSNMRAICLLFLATASLLVAIGIAGARPVRFWSFQELLDKSDLVVIATPTGTNDTKEHGGLPGAPSLPVIGVETRFAASAVLKGDKALKDFILHHYRYPADAPPVVNGPNLVSFAPGEKRTFLLFLVLEADGRYAPTVGQVDPGLCGINVLGGAGR